jgi:hypothetical protein
VMFVADFYLLSCCKGTKDFCLRQRHKVMKFFFATKSQGHEVFLFATKPQSHEVFSHLYVLNTFHEKL